MSQPSAYPSPGPGGQTLPQPGYAPGHPAAPGVPPLPTASPVSLVFPCRLCGCVPAAQVTFRGHQGMVFLMRFLHTEGPFCRDCGLHTFRRMTARTLVQGWYGYASFVITPITVLINAARRGAVAKLPAPRPPASGAYRAPDDPGPVLFARPQAIIGLGIPVLIVLLVIIAVATSSSS